MATVTGDREADAVEVAGRHAVVIGGSVAGLLAAHVLARFADRVTIVDRDRFPAGPASRPGVPQGRHSHVLLHGGQRALDDLLPGFTAELRAHGAPSLDVPHDVSTWQAGGWISHAGRELRLLTPSRPLLEWLLRRRVLAGPRIEVLQGTEAVGLLGDARRVRGVRVRPRGAAGRGDARPLPADLVVDASGRSTHAAEWLASLGAAVPRVEILDTGLAYATRGFRAPRSTAHLLEPDGATRQTRAFHYIADPQQLYGAVALPLEDTPVASPRGEQDGGAVGGGAVGAGTVGGGTGGGAVGGGPGDDSGGNSGGDPEETRYLVTLAGVRGHEPPTDEAAFADYVALLPDQALRTWLLKAVPDSPVFGHRSTANLRHRYDQLRTGAAGFLATGDALCAFNPVYGQGMAVAALSAVALRDTLGDPGHTPTTRRVQRAVQAATAQAWAISSGADKDMPGATGDAAGPRRLDAPLTWYLNRLQQLTSTDPEVARACRAAFSLAAPMSTLVAPRVVRSVLFGRRP